MDRAKLNAYVGFGPQRAAPQTPGGVYEGRREPGPNCRHVLRIIDATKAKKMPNPIRPSRASSNQGQP